MLVTNWFSHNELILNERKCKFILFGTRKNLLKFQYVKVCINGHSLEITNELKYLGVILDKSLSWSPQIENTKSKILRNFYVLRRARPYIDRDTAIVLYHTMIQSYFDYCHVVLAFSFFPSFTKIANITK